MKAQGFGKGYQYDHDLSQEASCQEFLPEGIEGTSFYTPSKNPKGDAGHLEREVRFLIRSAH